MRLGDNAHMIAHTDGFSAAINEVHVNCFQGQGLKGNARFHVFPALFKQFSRVFYIVPCLCAPYLAVPGHSFIILNVLASVVNGFNVHRWTVFPVIAHHGSTKGNEDGEYVSRIHLVPQIKQVYAESNGLGVCPSRYGQPIQIGDPAFRAGHHVPAIHGKQLFVKFLPCLPVGHIFNRQRFIRHRCHIANGKLLVCFHLFIVFCDQLFKQPPCRARVGVGRTLAVQQERTVTLTIHIFLIEEIPFIIQRTTPEDDLVILLDRDDALQLPDGIILRMSRGHYIGQRTCTVYVKGKLWGKKIV